MRYGSSSEEEEFPDVEVIVRKYHKKKSTQSNNQDGIHTRKGDEGNKENEKSPNKLPRSCVRVLGAVRVTPVRRRRKLGPSQIQTVDGSLLKSWTEAAEPQSERRLGGSRTGTGLKRSSRVPASTQDENTKETTQGSINESLDRLPVRTQKAGSSPAATNAAAAIDVAVYRSSDLEESKHATVSALQPEPVKKPTRRLISRKEKKAAEKKTTSYSNETEEVDTFIVETSVTEDEEGSEEDEGSEFLSSDGDNSSAHTRNSDSNLFSVPNLFRSDSPSDRPLRTLSSSSTTKGFVNREEKPTKAAENKGQTRNTKLEKFLFNRDIRENKAFSGVLKDTQQGGNLEDAFEKLKIFREDSDTDEPPSRGSDRNKATKLDPITPRKTLNASPFKPPKIPLSPWKPEHEEFWDPEVSFAWIDKHSPPKKTHDSSPVKKLDLTGGNIGDGKVELKRRYGTSPEKRNAKKVFDATKEKLARDFLRELDECITDGRLSQMTEETGGLRIEWSKTLNTTAGRAHWKCKTITTTSRPKDSAAVTASAPAASITKQHQAHIELATKVLTNQSDLLNTVAHEFCHLVVFMLDGGKPKSAHGPEFKAWGKRCSDVFGKERGIEVTTKHSYEIEYKYIWRCGDCGGEVKRHSKSVDVVRQRCGSCRGVLVQVKPIPRGSGGFKPGSSATISLVEEGTSENTKTAMAKQPRQQTAWQEFTAKEMKNLSATQKSMPFKDRMALLSARWKERQKQLRTLPDIEEQEQKQARTSDIPTTAVDAGDLDNVKGLTSAVEVLEIT